MAETFFVWDFVGILAPGSNYFINIFVKQFSKLGNRPDFEMGAQNSSKVTVIIRVFAKSAIYGNCKISESLCFIRVLEGF